MGVVEKGEVMARCCWCDGLVPSEGQTCDIDCYALWYAWMALHTSFVVVTPSGSVVSLAEGENPPLDLEFQGWYREAVGIKEESDV